MLGTHQKLTVVHIGWKSISSSFWHNCPQYPGRRMDTSTGSVSEDSLYTMYPTSSTSDGNMLLSLDHKCNFFEPPIPFSFRLIISVFHLRDSACFLIHTINLCGKQSSLITARTCTDLYDNVFAVIRIFLVKEGSSVPFQVLPLASLHQKVLLSAFLRISSSFFFFQHGKDCLNRFFIVFIFFIGIYDRLQLTLLFHQLLKNVPGCPLLPRLTKLIPELPQSPQADPLIYQTFCSSCIFLPVTTLSSPGKVFFYFYLFKTIFFHNFRHIHTLITTDLITSAIRRVSDMCPPVL